MRERAATPSAGGRILLFRFLSELKRCAAFTASKMRWCLCAIHGGGLLDRWAPGQTNVLHFASIRSLVVLIPPLLIKQEAMFSANWLYFPCFERSAFRFCQSFLQPKQPAETCADSGNHQSQKHYSCSPLAPEPDSLVNSWTSLL